MSRESAEARKYERRARRYRAGVTITLAIMAFIVALSFGDYHDAPETEAVYVTSSASEPAAPSAEDDNQVEYINLIGTGGRAVQVVQPDASPSPSLLYTDIGALKITGYVPGCAHCCGKTDAITASGVKATPGRTCAVAGLPFGTRIYIDGLGTYTVEDRGVRAGVVDVACKDHAECYKITGTNEVYVIEDGSGT